MKPGGQRNEKEIRKWMIDAELTVGEIKRALDVTHPVVSNTISGKRNSRKVLRYLLDKGCPKEHLDLPERFRGGEEVERRVRRRKSAKA